MNAARLGNKPGCVVLYVLEAKCFFMLDIYGKDEKDDLSTDEKKTLAQIAQELKRQALAALRRRSRENK